MAPCAGHLKGLSDTDVYRYLRQEHDATTGAAPVMSSAARVATVLPACCGCGASRTADAFLRELMYIFAYLTNVTQCFVI